MTSYTIGNTTILPSSIGEPYLGEVFTLPEDGTITDMGVGLDYSGTVHIKFAIYSADGATKYYADDTGQLVVGTSPIFQTKSGLSAHLVTGDYLFIFKVDDVAGKVCYQAGSGGDWSYGTATYGDPWPSTVTSNHYGGGGFSIYATYTPDTPHPTIFSDGFESGTFLPTDTPPGAWTGYIVDPPAINSSAPLKGIYSAYNSATAQSVYKTFTAPGGVTDDRYASGFFKFTSLSLNDGDEIQFFLLGNYTGDNYARCCIVADETGSYFALRNQGTELIMTSITPVVGVRYYVQIYACSNNPSIPLRMWVNGVLVATSVAGLGAIVDTVIAGDSFWYTASGGYLADDIYVTDYLLPEPTGQQLFTLINDIYQ